MTGWKLTKARAKILARLLDGGWSPWSAFISEGSRPSLRRTAFGRGKGRTIPWNGTGQPMLDAGWIEREVRSGWNIHVRITAAGRAALAAAEERGEQASTSPPSEDRR